MTDLLDTRMTGNVIVMADATVWVQGAGWCFNHAIHGNARPIFGGGTGTANYGIQGTIAGDRVQSTIAAV